MSAASNTTETNILNHFFRGVSTAAPSAVYIALYISDPTDADTGTEVSGTGYARQQITFGAPTQVGTKATITNSAKIEFGVAGSAWGTVAYFGIRTASSGGTLLAYAPFSAAKAVQAGDQLVIDIGNIVITLD